MTDRARTAERSARRPRTSGRGEALRDRRAADDPFVPGAPTPHMYAGRTRGCDQISRMVFMMVPALVATTPPSIAPAIIFGDCKPLPLHFSQAKRPPA